MIKRVADEVFDDSTFTRIAESMKQNSKKLFSVVNSETEAQKIKNDLNVNGYQASYEKKGERYNVFYSPTAPKFKIDEQILNQFQNLGDNKYRAFNKTKVAGLFDYSFDEGSIWTLKIIDGEQYLVKEVEDDNEDAVIRTKKASKINKIYTDDLDKKLAEFLNKNDIVVSNALLKDIKSKVIATLLDAPSIQEKIKKFCKGENIKWLQI